MLKQTNGLSRIAMAVAVVALAAGCATSGDLEEVRTIALDAQATAAAAQRTADAAAATAGDAQATAAAALNEASAGADANAIQAARTEAAAAREEAQAALACCRANTQRIERSFESSVRK